MTNYDQRAVNAQASERHRNVCQASELLRESDYFLPNVIVDLESHEFVLSEDAHGHPVLRCWAECQDCNRSGYIDLPYTASLLLSSHLTSAPAPQTDAANIMGGGDVSAQYLSAED